jgi:hypothetical protein
MFTVHIVTIKGFILPTYAQYSYSSVIHPYTYFGLLLANVYNRCIVYAILFWPPEDG